MSPDDKRDRLIERLANHDIYPVLPRGIDVAYDIGNAFPEFRVEVVFDVGANVGQSAKRYLASFPGSQIYCFEPVGDTFRQLQKNLRNNDRIHFVQLALGSYTGKAEMALQGNSDRFYLLSAAKDQPANLDVRTEDVDIERLDKFCRNEAIERINFLKIDTEGADLEVLQGGESMLKEQRIDFVEVEAGMNAGNKRHVPFQILQNHLESRGYLLFGFYEQMHEWPTNEPHLRRTNPVFMSRRMIKQDKQKGAD